MSINELCSIIIWWIFVASQICRPTDHIRPYQSETETETVVSDSFEYEMNLSFTRAHIHTNIFKSISTSLHYSVSFFTSRRSDFKCSSPHRVPRNATATQNQSRRYEWKRKECATDDAMCRWNYVFSNSRRTKNTLNYPKQYSVCSVWGCAVHALAACRSMPL